ncbi:MAG: hypothetical protein AB4372_33685 [Xenococcus sp. (in: cyanobacteria)]
MSIINLSILEGVLTEQAFSDRFVEGKGIIGDINLDASSISLNNTSQIVSFISGEGTGGNINLNSDSIFIVNQSNIRNTTSINNTNIPSNIEINATEFIEIRGRNSRIASETGGLGNAGNINISTPELKILDSGQISANNFLIETLEIFPNGRLIRNKLEQPIEGSGNAGTIDITADNITLENRGGITTLSSTGEGGNIQLQVNDLLSLRNNSEISATAGLEGTPGNGGDININSTLIVAFPNQNNDITANAFEGNGGNIKITTEGIFGLAERSSNPPNNTNDIDASSEFGLDGTVSIITPDINRIQTDIELPNEIIESEPLGENACSGGRGTEASSFVVKGKGGIPRQPIDPFESDPILVDEQIATPNLQTQYPDIKPIKTSIGDIYPARGIIQTVDGKIVLTAYPTDNTNTRTAHKSANCTP